MLTRTRAWHTVQERQEPDWGGFLTEGCIGFWWAVLALGELEAATGAGLAVLLTFDLTGVAAEEIVFAQDGFEGGVEFHEGAGEAQDDGAGLASVAATGDIDEHVNGADDLGELQGVGDVATVTGFGEVHVDFFVVDEVLAGAGLDADAGDGGLATARAPVEPGFIGALAAADGSGSDRSRGAEAFGD
jgi:hypothetical protein